MKYSEAMRLGAMLAPQAYGVFKDQNGNTCANGAVMEAMGVNLIPMGQHFKDWRKTLSSFPEAMIPATCPVCGKHSSSYVKYYGEQRNGAWGIVADCLNNTHKWTREQIADWLEREIEPQVYGQKTATEEGKNEVLAGR